MMWKDFRTEARFIDYLVIITGIGTAALLLIDHQYIGASGWFFFCFSVFLSTAEKAVFNDQRKLLNDAMDLLNRIFKRRGSHTE